MHVSDENDRRRWPETVVVLAFAALMLQRFTHHVDLHIADEVLYQLQGRALLDGELTARTLAYNPVYSVAYALLQLLPLHGTAVQDAMGAVVVTATTLAAWWCVAAFASRPAALVAAAWWGSSTLAVGYTLRMYVFMSALYFVAAGFAGRGRTVLALATLTAAALGRSEVLPWLLGASACVLGIGVWRRAPSLRRAGGGFVLVGAALGVLVATLPEAREHSWFAFAWHYTGNTIRPGAPPPGAEPTAAPLLEETFPGAHSVGAAVLANPTAIAEHVVENVPYVADMVAPLVGRPFAYLPALRWSLLLAAALAVAAGVVAWSFGRRGPPSPARTPGLAVLGSSLLVVPPLLVFFPRSDVLLPVVPFVLVVGARLAERGCAALTAWLGVRVPAPAALAVGLVLGVPLVFGGPFVQTAAETRLARAAITLLQRNDLPPGARVMMLQSRPMVALAGIDAVPVETAVAMAAAASGGEIATDYAMLTTWEYTQPYRDRLLDELTTERWRLVDGTETAWLFAKAAPR